jgi:hypothetical protein
MTTPELLQAFETCPRKGFFLRSWAPRKRFLKDLTQEAVRAGMLAPGPADEQGWGDIAGSRMLQLAADYELDSSAPNHFDCALHHANLADILVSAIRKKDDPPWITPPDSDVWKSGCFLSPDGNSLRRIVLVSNWTDSRHYGECRSWATVGEMAQYDLPMQLVVLIVGQERAGKRHSAWTTGFLHPMNKVLRFRKRNRMTTEVFNDRWIKVFREDHDEISREKWLEAMLKDDVLQDLCFRVDVPKLPTLQRTRLVELAKRKVDRLSALSEKPETNLSTCDWPVTCSFRPCCHSIPEREPSAAVGFVWASSLNRA